MILQASLSGFAAAQCGEALPHRRREKKEKEAPPPCVEAQPRRGKSKSSFSVSQRLTALCGGRAATSAHRSLLTVLLLSAFCLLPARFTPSLTVGLLTPAFSQNETPTPQAQPS